MEIILQESKWKMVQQASPFQWNFSTATQNDTQWSPWLYSCLTTLGYAPNETMDGVLHGVLGNFLPDLDQVIAKLLYSLRCNMVASDTLKHNVPEEFYWIVRWVWGLVSDIKSFILPSSSCLHPHTRLGIVMHQEEPRTHSIRVGSDTGFKDFILITNGSQGAVV